MKASQATEPGFYWYFGVERDQAVTIVQHEDRWFYFIGNDTPFGPDELDGQLIGPFTYADMQGEADEPPDPG